MEIKYIWSRKTNDTNEVNSVTMKSEAVPRVGELVDISVNLSRTETVEKTGRVKSVSWYVRNKSYVCVFLDV